MRHLPSIAIFGLLLLAPALAHADVAPPGCRRCSVDGEAGGGALALLVAGLTGLALRRGGRRTDRAATER